jgi:hypothetical protein
LRVARQPMVVFDHPDDARRRGSGLSRRLSGRSGALPGTYGMKASELAQLLNEARERATNDPPCAELQPDPDRRV